MLRLRRPVPFWLLALGTAALTALIVSALVGRVDAAAARWGALEPVAVATGDIAVGAEIAASDVAVEERPAAMLPAGTLRRPPVGRRATSAIAAGEPILASRVAPAGTGRLTALLPVGTKAIAVPLDRARVPLEPGDVVDLLATFDPTVAGDGDPTFAVAERALVLDAAEDAVTVAVAAREAAPVAFALANGIVTVALTSTTTTTT